MQNNVIQYLLRLGDDRLVLGHRLSEWCGHGPILEEDIALANIALDLIGQANLFLGLAGELEELGRDADQLAYFRDETAFRNLQMVELPRGDFGFTIARQFLFDAWSVPLLGTLAESTHTQLGALAARALKESRYHLRHSSEWMIRLGDGTAESHARVSGALAALWRYTGEMFLSTPLDESLAREGIAPEPGSLRSAWDAHVREVFSRATLEVPEDPDVATGGREGRHTEHLGHLLAEMQILARSHPGASW